MFLKIHKFFFRVIFCAFFYSGACAQEPFEFRDINGGWHEAVIVTRDLGNMITFFEKVAGWHKQEEGELSQASFAYYTGRKDAGSGRYAVMKSPDFSQGWVRIISLEGVDQKVRRPHAQSWDTGGIFFPNGAIS